VAHGFAREKGAARGYVNVDNPLFAPGQRLSRRQYDAMVAAQGARRPLAAMPEPEAQLRRERQGAGQRRYNLMLDLYVRQQREAGRVVNKRQAAADPAFKQAVKLSKGTPNPRHNPNIRDRNMRDRRRGFAVVGGADKFREEYEAQYGRPRRPGRRRGRREGF
jgi:hypothetical protein